MQPKAKNNLNNPETTKKLEEIELIILQNPNLLAQLNKKFETKTKAKMRLLTNHLPGFVYLCENDEFYTVKFVSYQVQQILGYSPEEFLENKTSFAKLIHPDDLHFVVNTANKAVEQKHNYEIHYRAFHKNGEIKYLHELGKGIFENDLFLGLEGYIQDETDLVLKQIALNQSEQYYKSILNQSPIGIVIIDNNIIKFINQTAVDLIKGQSIAYFQDKAIENLVFEENRPYFLGMWPKFIESIQAGEKIEQTFICYDNSVAFFQFSGGTIVHNNQVVTQLVFSDITAKKEAELKLLENEKKFRGVFENAAHGVVLCNEKKEIFECNNRFCELLGFAYNELLHQSIFETIVLPKNLNFQKE